MRERLDIAVARQVRAAPAATRSATGCAAAHAIRRVAAAAAAAAAASVH